MAILLDDEGCVVQIPGSHILPDTGLLLYRKISWKFITISDTESSDENLTFSAIYTFKLVADEKHL